MNENSTYKRLQTFLAVDLIKRGQEENPAAKVIYQHVLDAAWPVVCDLLAQVAEHEHALEEVVIPHHGPHCESCTRMARSALDGVNRADFREMIDDDGDI